MMNRRHVVCEIVHDKDSDTSIARELKDETGLLVDPADVDLVHVERGRDQASRLIIFVFATDAWINELTNTEPDKYLTAQQVCREPSDRFRVPGNRAGPGRVPKRGPFPSPGMDGQ
ncbi:hypothetical protein ACIQMP_16780 [Streptomyces sp. NPDC091385]|uniref:hypothetical protein n=1 Tax=Streptomyces sp. NPDC091385 TaxID=3365997 RepID=UPI0037FEB3FE